MKVLCCNVQAWVRKKQCLHTATTCHWGCDTSTPCMSSSRLVMSQRDGNSSRLSINTYKCSIILSKQLLLSYTRLSFVTVNIWRLGSAWQNHRMHHTRRVRTMCSPPVSGSKCGWQWLNHRTTASLIHTAHLYTMGHVWCSIHAHVTNNISESFLAPSSYSLLLPLLSSAVCTRAVSVHDFFLSVIKHTNTYFWHLPVI